MIESLEHRRLMRGGVVRFEGRTLTITGTAGDDVITLRGGRTAIVVALNGKATPVMATDIRRVVVYAGAGDDVVDAGGGRVVGGRSLPVRCLLDGGTGDDTVYSGRASDTLLGGRGDDRLYGDGPTDPYDYHDGGPGNDRMMYGGVMNGGSGTDVADDGNDNGELPIVSGIERLYCPVGFASQRDENGRILPSAYRGDLSTVDDHLVFRIPTRPGYDTTLSGPAVRADGTLAVTLTQTFKAQDYRPPTAAVTITIDPDAARRRGIVLTYADATSPYFPEQTVLLPTA